MDSRTLKKLRTFIPLVLLPVFGWAPSTFAQGTAFTYQGGLNDNGAPASGTYDLRFKLFTDFAGNDQAGGTVLTNGIFVTNGLFTTTIDSGAGIFAGSNLWLEGAVRTNGGGGYSTLSPLQPLTPTPYAIFAGSASNVSGTISSASLSGVYSGPVTFNNPGNSFNGAFNGFGRTLCTPPFPATTTTSPPVRSVLRRVISAGAARRRVCVGGFPTRAVCFHNYETHPFSVYYAPPHWTIYNDDGASITNMSFNVLIIKP